MKALQKLLIKKKDYREVKESIRTMKNQKNDSEKNIF